MARGSLGVALRGAGTVRFPAWSGALSPTLPALAQPPTRHHLAPGADDPQTQRLPTLPVALRQTVSAPVVLGGERELSAQPSVLAICGRGDALNLKAATGQGQVAGQKYWDELPCGLRSALSDTDRGEKGQDWT